MTSDRDIERILDHWLTERPTQVSDRVLDEVADRIARHPQQPAWRVSRRDFHVSTYLKPLLAVAAVVVIAVAGLAVLQPGAGSNVGGPASPAPSPSPAPSASPSPAPSAGAVFPDWFTAASGSNGAGILPPGTAATRAFLPGSTFSGAAGWVNDIDTADFYGLFPDTPANRAEFGRSGSTAQGILIGIVDTPNLICEGVDTHGSTAAELADSLVANEALVTSEPVDVTIGGLTGTRVDAHIDPDWTGSCRPFNPDATTDPKDHRGRFVFLDVPSGGKLGILVQSVDSADFEAFLAEAMPIIESFQFDVAP
jgi:hypothetical protein